MTDSRLAAMLGCVALALCLTACTSAEEQYEQDLGARIEPHRSALDGLHSGLGAAQAAARDRPALRAIDSSWSGPAVAWRYDAEMTAVAIMEGTDLSPPFTPPPPPRPDAPTPLTPRVDDQLLALAAGNMPPFDEDESTRDAWLRLVERHANAASSVRYAVVCRTIGESPPRLEDGAYTPGGYEGECRVFALEGAEYLGGFTVTASNAEEERVTTGSGAPTTVLGQLRGRLSAQLAAQAHAALAASGTSSPQSVPF